MDRFQYTKLARIVRFITPKAYSFIDPMKNAFRWSMVWVCLVALPIALFTPETLSKYGLLTVGSFMVLLFCFIAIIGAAHGEYPTPYNSSLSSKDRKGIKELRKTRTEREKRLRNV